MATRDQRAREANTRVKRSQWSFSFSLDLWFLPSLQYRYTFSCWIYSVTPNPINRDPELSSSISFCRCNMYFFLVRDCKGKTRLVYFRSNFSILTLFFIFYFFFLVYKVYKLNAIDCQYIVLYGIELNRESIPSYEYFSLCVILRETIVKMTCKMRERKKEREKRLDISHFSSLYSIFYK